MSDEVIESKSAKIAALNDNLRLTLQGGKIMFTAGVDALSPDVKAVALTVVRAFDQFTKDNDPHGEHDFGAFEVLDDKFFWKIDYYDKELKFGSEDPADPEKTTRVLLIMLRSEY